MPTPARPTNVPYDDHSSLIGPDQAYCSHFRADEIAVRSVLGDLKKWLVTSQIDAETCGTVELVLAEALNNIVEHAYADQPAGPVELGVWRHDTFLSFELSDAGSALPARTLPAGELPTTDCAIADLPEGGFGWFLIHRLTEGLLYERKHQRNRLCFNIRNSPTVGD